MLDNKNIFNINPYYDDFEEDKGFLRILFKPGYPVQARELTQAQSILQNQISSISDHVFKNGSRVLGGTIGIRTAQYIKVDVSDFAIGTDYSSFVGARVTAVSLWEADVISIVAPSKFDLRLTLIVNVISGDIIRTPATLKDSNGVSYNMNIVADGVGVCKSISLSSGVYYINGMFVIAESQTFSPYKNETSTVFDEETNESIVVVSRNFSFAPDFQSLTKKIGFRIISSVVSYVEDSSIRDPAQKTGNYNAPGADRYKIKLELNQEDVDVFSSDFIELMRFDNGKITKRINRVSYGEIEKALNTRTFEESGSYTVSPFDLNVSEIIPNGLTLDYVMGSGKAYVYGQQINSQYSKIISVPKARTFTTEPLVNLTCSLGNYLNVIIDTTSTGTTFINNFDVICSGSSRVKFMNNASVVADGFIHACLPDQYVDGQYKVYLHGISGSINNATNLDVYVKLSTTKTVSFLPPPGQTYFGNIEKQNLQSLVFPVSPGYAIKEIQDATFTTKISSNNLTPNSGYVFQTTGSATKTIITIQSDKITNTINAQNNSISFMDYTDAAGQDDLSEIFVVNSSGKIFRPAVHAFGCLLSSNDEATSFVLTINTPPAGFTSGSLRLVFPIKYTLSGTDYRRKTSAIATDTFYQFSTREGKSTLPLSNIDVYSITSITQGGVDISDKFELDDGQHETYYAKSFLIKKNLIEAIITNSTPIRVEYEYFVHSGLAFAPFLGKISYPETSYEKIPIHVNPRNGVVVSLANCLDFRSSDPSDGVPILKTFGISEFGGVDSKVMTKYTHYLPRVDRVCVKADSDNSAEFFVLQGVPDMSPSAPIETNNSLTLYTIAVPAYTHNASDVSIVQNSTKRYTMSEISNIEKRIDDVEIFSKLSIVENETNSRQIPTTSATQPLKTSIYIDEFYGHSKADVSSFDHICSVDYERGELRPFFESKFIQSENWSLSNTVRSIDGIITLRYVPYTYLENLQWNKKITINPSSVVSWQGFAKITNNNNEGDFSNSSFFDSSFRPSVKTNTIQENNNWLGSNANNNKGFGTQWNDWESLWFGKESFIEEQDDIFRKTFELARINSNSVVSSNNSGSVVSAISRNMSVLDSSSSKLIRASRLRNRIREVVDSRVVDHSVVPFIKKQSLIFSAHGLKPNSTGLNLYFDGIKLETTDISTDNFGSCSVSFEIPRNTFLSGNKIIRISDDPNIENCTMAAEAIFTCAGIYNKRSYGINTTRVPLLRRQTVSSEIISTNPFDRDLGNDILENSQWSDPMSQTFVVDKSRNPNGIFLSSVDLYFATKHPTLPVTIQIRPTISGVANPSVSFPFSTVVLPSSSVSVNPNQPPSPTSFVFSSPIFLEPGEYSISILCNTNAYSLYSANSYSSGIESNEGSPGSVGNNSLTGSLYVPSIIGELIKENTTSLMFSLTSCSFEESSGSAMLGDDYGIDSSQVISTNISSISPVGCSISPAIINNALELPIRNLENFYPDTLLVENSYITYRLQRGADISVSPVLDSRTFCGFGVEMYNESSYISRVVDTDFIISDGIIIFAEVVTPQDTKVTINYRTLKNGESDIFSKMWKSVDRISEDVISSSDLDYHEAIYKISSDSGFTSYQLQIVLTSPNGSVYSHTPSVRSIKSITFVE